MKGIQKYDNADICCLKLQHMKYLDFSHPMASVTVRAHVMMSPLLMLERRLCSLQIMPQLSELWAYVYVFAGRNSGHS